MKNPRIHYVTSSYCSHARAANSYLGLIKAKYPIVATVESADIVIIHKEPHNYGAIFEAHPVLRQKYVIGYCVWEATELPEAYRRSISHVQEVWTCSQYCHNVFKNYHASVTRIPHTIHRPVICHEKDRQFVRTMTDYRDRHFYYLTITQKRDRRKNLRGLIRAFQNLSHSIPNARLIVKTSSNGSGIPHWDGPIVYIPGWFSESQINALYELAHVYVSLHHAEGWGLTLSDAMIFQKPVLATGYSGNLEFMNDENSILVDYSEENIHHGDCFGSFNAGMKWAYPDEEDAAKKMYMLYEAYHSSAIDQKIKNATERIKIFSPAVIADCIYQRLEQIGSFLR